MHRFDSRYSRFLAHALTVVMLLSGSLFGQDNGGGTGGGTTGGGGDTTTNAFAAAGVVIDAARVLNVDENGLMRVTRADPRLTMQKLMAAKADLSPRLARPSPMRKVSLNRLERAVSAEVAAGRGPSPEMITLAGLTRLEYVFFYPESGDIVIAGPAEGFGQDAVGRFAGVESGKPCLLLDDLIVALRSFGPSGEVAQVISVSIDPTQEGLARMQQTLQQLGSTFRGPAQVPFILQSLKRSLGRNDVTITGVPARTHFAHVLTEADYRMKLIGINLERPPVRMQSYVDRLTATMTPPNALVRWYFVPDYQAISTTEDGTAMKMVGQGVKLVGEDELVTRDGGRKSSGRRANPASRGFTEEFSQKFRQISENSPIYSQLRNLVDLTIAAAFIQSQDFYGQSGWDLGVFADEDRLSVEVFPAPRQVETAVNAVMKGRRLITPIGGGVAIQAQKALEKDNISGDTDGSLARQHAGIELQNIPLETWWWD